ncbi:MAG: hypothetical protein ACPF9D_14030, partial [Owenweeksia sp.]
MKKVTFTLVLIAFAYMASAQAWSPVGSGIPVTLLPWNSMMTTESGGNIYVGYSEWNNGTQTNSTSVSVWNGLGWTNLPNISGNVYLVDIEVYNGAVYTVLGS